MTVEETINNIKEIQGIITDAVPCYNPDGSLDRYMITLNKAMAALKKQIPKKPMDVCDVPFDIPYGVCGVCGDGVNGDMRFCDICGNALDWSDEE